MLLFAVENVSMFEPASPPATAIRDLSYLVLAITGVIFVLVEGTLVYCIVRFRRRSEEDTAEPPQIYGSQPIEVAWTLAPLLVVFVLFLVVVRTVVEIRQDTPPEGAVQVTVIGHQWWWEYRYHDPEAEGETIVTANEMHVPLDVPVYLNLESEDVAHSFWVPRLAGKTDVIPGRVNRMWFQARQPGIFQGQCAEYCGAQHANMLLRVIVESREDFDRWLAQQKRPAASRPEANEGRKLFLSLACVSCHAVRGTTARGTFGPDLTHLKTRETLGARTLANNRDNLLDWVHNPQQKQMKPGCNMPSLHLSEQQAALVVDYLMTLE